MQLSILEGFYDELEKIGTSYRMANHLQARRGTRPIRAHNLLSKSSPDITEPEQTAQDPDLEQPESAQLVGEEDEGASVGKTASSEDTKERVMRGFVKAQPYASSAAKAAVPAALLGGVYGGKRTAKAFGTVGALAGLASQGLRDWAEKNKRKSVAKEILRQGER